jgi:hypothetical protein
VLIILPTKKTPTSFCIVRAPAFSSSLQAYTARSCATVFDTFIADMETTRRDDAARGRLQTSPSPILLQHDTTAVKGSVSRVAEIIDRLRAVGFTFVRIDECFDYGAGMVAPFAPQVAVGSARRKCVFFSVFYPLFCNSLLYVSVSASASMHVCVLFF